MRINAAGIVTGIVAAGLIMTAGCIDSTVTVAVRKDGSGGIREVTYLSASVAPMLQMMAGMQKSSAGGTNQPGASVNPMLDRAQYERRAAKMGDGVRVVSLKEVKNDKGATGVQVDYAFPDVRKIRLSMDMNMGGMSQGMDMAGGFDVQPGGPASGDNSIGFDFVPGLPTQLTVILPSKTNIAGQAEEPAPGAAPEEALRQAPDPGELAMVKTFFADMHMALIVKVDGEIVKTGASHVLADKTTGLKNGITIADIDFSKIMDDQNVEKLMALQDEKDQAVALKKLGEMPGIKFEPADKVEIQFR